MRSLTFEQQVFNLCGVISVGLMIVWTNVSLGLMFVKTNVQKNNISSNVFLISLFIKFSSAGY